MRNWLSRHFQGALPQTVGVYSGEAGVCLVKAEVPSGYRCIYQPPTPEAEQPALLSAMQRLRALSPVAQRHVSLSVALDADEVFVRPLTLPSGLSDDQVAQIAIVEAVANLPVPPEEICLDFIRAGSVSDSDETVRLAFCRRERIDEILAQAETAAVTVSVIDRDIQALHDALVSEHGRLGLGAPFEYPFGIITQIKPRLLICLSPNSFETYPIRISEITDAMAFDALRQQVVTYWNRSCMLRADEQRPLSLVLLLDARGGADRSMQTSSDGAPAFRRLAMSELQGAMLDDEVAPPLEARLIALGMAGRQL